MDAQVPPINYGAMTSQQKVARYARELLMSVYVSRTVGAAKTTADSTVVAAQAQAITDAKAGLT